LEPIKTTEKALASFNIFHNKTNLVPILLVCPYLSKRVVPLCCDKITCFRRWGHPGSPDRDPDPDISAGGARTAPPASADPAPGSADAACRAAASAAFC
jgi:hypothetical protein